MHVCVCGENLFNNDDERPECVSFSTQKYTCKLIFFLNSLCETIKFENCWFRVRTCQKGNADVQ